MVVTKIKRAFDYASCYMFIGGLGMFLFVANKLFKGEIQQIMILLPNYWVGIIGLIFAVAGCIIMFESD
jgi:uncharacterized protein YjeT (DUF2065 family)